VFRLKLFHYLFLKLKKLNFMTSVSPNREKHKTFTPGIFVWICDKHPRSTTPNKIKLFFKFLLISYRRYIYISLLYQNITDPEHWWIQIGINKQTKNQ
jgi:hypothetical protein